MLRLAQSAAGPTADAEEQEPPLFLPKADVIPPDQGAFRQAPGTGVIVEEVSPVPAKRQAEPVETQPPVLFVPPPPRNLAISPDEPETYGASSSLPRQRAEGRPAAPAFDF